MMAEKKSIFVTYLLWLFFGLFGAHHFYLRRDRQAFVWWMSFGGYFGIGWISDLFMIPSYVRAVNGDREYLEDFIARMKAHPTPPYSLVRSVLQIAVADALGHLTVAAVPLEYIPENWVPLTDIFVPLAVAIGVHVVGNLGQEQEGSLLYAIGGAYVVYPIYLIGFKSVFLTSFFSAYAFNSYAKKWRRTPKKVRPLWKRILIISLCGVLYLSLWASYLYFNCTIVTEDNTEVKFRDAAKHFFKSPMWNEFLLVMKTTWQMAQHHGWREVWKHILEAFDPDGKANALKVLGLPDNATNQEITTVYRKLSRQWHPDKHKDLLAKEQAQEKFIEIAQAYEVLMKSNRKTPV